MNGAPGFTSLPKCSFSSGLPRAQLDAYPAYDQFFLDPKRELVEAGCWAHARRHVFQARHTDPSRMGAVLAYIAQLYAAEKRARKAGEPVATLPVVRKMVCPVDILLRNYGFSPPA